MFVFAKFRKVREKRANTSEELIELWNKYSSQLEGADVSEERNLIFEQVFIAACEMHNFDVAESCINFLKAQYPHSFRVRRLLGIYFECTEQYDAALSTYDYLLENDETDSFAMKRRICVLLSQRKIPDAINSLVEYTKKFQTDKEAWICLSDAYIEKLNFTYAAFCLEELLLHHPQNSFFILRYAEIKYAMGHYEIARSYFLYAYQVDPKKNTLIALYGVLLSCRNILIKARSDFESTKLLAWARREIEHTLKSAAIFIHPTAISQSFDMLLGC